MMSSISLKAPIKINLALHILGQEAGGYHLLQTLVVFAANGDRISIAPSTQDTVQIEGPYGHNLCAGDNNLIVRARDLLRDFLGASAYPVSLTLTKNLPIASGLGGGSADAATTLLALSHIWQRGKNVPSDLVRSLGADVPMCLHALQHRQAILATGIGDKITPLPSFPPLDMVIINPLKALSTSRVFKALETKNNLPFIFPTQALHSTQNLVQALKQMRNDLYEPACGLMPQTRQIMEELQQTQPLLARMSGSGASCFAIYANYEQACQAAAMLKCQHSDYFIQTIRTMGKETK